LPPSSTTTASPPSTIALLDTLKDKTGQAFESGLPRTDTKQSTSKTIIIPPERTRYLAEIAETVRDYHRHTESRPTPCGRCGTWKRASRPFRGRT
jgi:hypothetical protein